jgi:phosphogluconate dehydratase
MALHPKIAEVTDRIRARSEGPRRQYLDTMARAAAVGPRRSHLTCGNQAHAYAAMGDQKDALVADKAPNIGIITAYNDMLSAHQPFETYPTLIKKAAIAAGATAQVAGGVPAMCDGVTQGQTGMELSLFSRDVIALSAAVGLSHNTFDAAIYLGVCDKIVSWPPRPLAISPPCSCLRGPWSVACPTTKNLRSASNSPPAKSAARN